MTGIGERIDILRIKQFEIRFRLVGDFLHGRLFFDDGLLARDGAVENRHFADSAETAAVLLQFQILLRREFDGLDGVGAFLRERVVLERDFAGLQHRVAIDFRIGGKIGEAAPDRIERGVDGFMDAAGDSDHHGVLAFFQRRAAEHAVGGADG